MKRSATGRDGGVPPHMAVMASRAGSPSDRQRPGPGHGRSRSRFTRSARLMPGGYVARSPGSSDDDDTGNAPVGSTDAWRPGREAHALSCPGEGCDPAGATVGAERSPFTARRPAAFPVAEAVKKSLDATAGSDIPLSVCGSGGGSFNGACRARKVNQAIDQGEDNAHV